MRPVFNNFSSGHKKKHYFLSVPERLETSDIAHFSCFITALYLICSKLRFWDLYTKKADFIEKSALFCFIAEREGFEPPAPLSAAVFKTAVIDHSTISPDVRCGRLSFQKRCKGMAFLGNVQVFPHFY